MPFSRDVLTSRMLAAGDPRQALANAATLGATLLVLGAISAVTVAAASEQPHATGARVSHVEAGGAGLLRRAKRAERRGLAVSRRADARRVAKESA